MINIGKNTTMKNVFITGMSGFTGTHLFNLLNSKNYQVYGIYNRKKRIKIKNAKIIDLTPTILHLFNIPIPDDMDGRVLTECFEEDSELPNIFIKK